jgi:glycosyltransferase involved in cell wall biosynthesis
MIRLAAHIHNEDGWGRHARNFAQALNRYEPTELAPLGVRESGARSLWRRLRPSWTDSVGITLGSVEHTLALKTRYRVPFYVGETTRIPRHLLFFLRRAEMVWTASQWGRQVLEAHQVASDKIRVVPEGVDTRIFAPPPAGQRTADVFRESFRDVFRFLCVAKWEERKGTADLVRAFVQEFNPAEPVELVMHCGGPGVQMPEARSEIAACAGIGGRRVVVSEPVSLPELAALMQRSNAFVLPTRAEGWGLPILEAMACELPCIVTGYSGLTEFANQDNCFLIRVESMCKVHDPKFYSTRYDWGEWAQPDLAHLRSLMRLVYENREIALTKAKRAREDAARLWSWDQAARTAMAHLKELRAGKGSH